MEDTNKSMKCDCKGICMRGSMNSHHHVGRFILAILIVMVSFWVGMKLGEIKGYMMATGMMHSRTDNGMMIYKMEHRNDMRTAPVKVTPEAAPVAPQE